MVKINGTLIKLLRISILVSFIPCIQAIKFKSDFYHFKQIKDTIYRSIIDESHNWNENRECLSELNAIKNAFNNSDEWAIEIIDAWGNFPSGTISGNFFDLGAFSQCFHIERNGSAYKTQYCIGQLKYRGQIETNTVKPRLDVGPGVSIGLCLPSVCSVSHLASLVDKVIREQSNKMTFAIPEQTCQFEESISDSKSLDSVALYFFGIALLLVVGSTSYDIFEGINGRKKYQPLLAFSLYKNGKKLFSCQKSQSTDQIDCLHGIRSLTTVWTVFIHTFTMYAWLPIHHQVTVLKFMKTIRFMLLPSAHVIIDTFLVLSGLLTSFTLLAFLKKNRSSPYGLVYLERYLRVTPMLAIYMLVSMTFLRFMGNGPMWPLAMEFLSGNCQRYWWSTLLHIQNYVNPGEICLANTWYISVDMQLFILAPIIIHLIHRYNTKAIMGLVALILACMGLTMAVHLKYNLTTLLENRKIEIAYFPTHIRYSSWVIGVITGYIFNKYPRGTIRIPKALNLCAWMLTCAAIAVVILATYPLHQESFVIKLTPIHYGLYDAFSRVLWSIALSYIIFACAHNAGGPINRFLSHPWWLPLSRLSYSICLFHYPFIIFMMFTLKSTTYFDDIIGFHSFIANFVLSVFIGILTTLAFESPINNIQKIIFISIECQVTRKRDAKKNK